jgi:hypothetical protein
MFHHDNVLQRTLAMLRVGLQGSQYNAQDRPFFAERLSATRPFPLVVRVAATGQ